MIQLFTEAKTRNIMHFSLNESNWIFISSNKRKKRNSNRKVVSATKRYERRLKEENQKKVNELQKKSKNRNYYEPLILEVYKKLGNMSTEQVEIASEAERVLALLMDQVKAQEQVVKSQQFQETSKTKESNNSSFSANQTIEVANADSEEDKALKDEVETKAKFEAAKGIGKVLQAESKMYGPKK